MIHNSTSNSRTEESPVDARAALLAWLRSCPRAELRTALGALPFRRLQQLHELFEFDPPTDDKPSAALSQEARCAVLAKRAATGLSLWNEHDLIHHQGKATGLSRIGRVVSRRRNGSIAVGTLQRVDWTPPPEKDQWETIAAELAADQAAMAAAQTKGAITDEGDRTIPGGATAASQDRIDD